MVIYFERMLFNSKKFSNFERNFMSPEIKDINKNNGLVGVGPLPNQAPVGAFQINGINNLVDTKGYIAYHYRHTYSPDRNSIQAGTNVNGEVANRFAVQFYEIRQIYVIMQSVTLESRLQADAIYGHASGIVNISGKYLDGLKERVFVRPRDLIVLNPTITEQATELLEYNPNGDLRAKHRIVAVDYLASVTQRFENGPDFVVSKDGVIQWIPTGNKPKPSEVLSIVYWFSPVWIVSRNLHMLRLIPSNAYGHGAYPRELEYAPQQLVVVQNHLQDSNEQLDFSGLPLYSGYADTANVTGGSL